MLALPTSRADGLVKDIHIHASVFVKKKHNAVLLCALNANVNLVRP
jgi:hypothetical protein